MVSHSGLRVCVSERMCQCVYLPNLFISLSLFFFLATVVAVLFLFAFFKSCKCTNSNGNIQFAFVSFIDENDDGVKTTMMTRKNKTKLWFKRGKFMRTHDTINCKNYQSKPITFCVLFSHFISLHLISDWLCIA